MPAIGCTEDWNGSYREIGLVKVAALQESCHATADMGLFSGPVLVADRGEVIYKDAFGLANHQWNIPNTTDTKLRLASVSKQFCRLMVMQLVQEGKVNLDDTVTDHLRYYRKDTGEKITSLQTSPIECPAKPTSNAQQSPRRMPSNARVPQDQRMCELVKSQGVEAAMDWCNSNTTKITSSKRSMSIQKFA